MKYMIPYKNKTDFIFNEARLSDDYELDNGGETTGGSFPEEEEELLEELFELLISIFDKNRIRKFGEILFDECVKNAPHLKFKTSFTKDAFQQFYIYKISFISPGEDLYTIEIDPRGFFISRNDGDYNLSCYMLKDMITPVYCCVLLKLFFKKFKYGQTQHLDIKHDAKLRYPLEKRVKYWIKITDINIDLYKHIKNRLPSSYSTHFKYLERAYDFGMFDTE